MAITTSFLNSFKTDLFSALHNFNAVTTFTASGTSTQTLTSVSSLVGLAVGMVLSGTNIAAGTVIAAILSGTSIFISKATTGAPGTITATGDVINMALIKHTPTGTYNASNTNYTDITGNSDEASGTGYTAGGQAMTNVSPVISTSTAVINFSPNPSWTTVTVDVDGCMIYNTIQRGPVATRACSVHDFGGEQKVTAGTFTVVMPAAVAATAILRIA